MNWKEHKEQLLKDKDFRAEYSALALEHKVASELIRLRLSKGLTQEQLASKTNTKQAGIARLESGSSLPSLSTVRRVAEALDAELEVVIRPRRPIVRPPSSIEDRFPISKRTLATFCRRSHIRRLSLFGSVLRTDFRPDSDIDVLVEFEPGHVPGFGIVDMEKELSLMVGRKVDLRTLHDLSRHFRAEVVREARHLYAAG